MATSTFDFDTDGNAGTRNQLKNHHQDILPEYMGNRNNGGPLTTNANKQDLSYMDHGPLPTITTGRNKIGTMESNAALPRPMSDYAYNDGPIYHHVNAERAVYDNSSLNLLNGKQNEISVGDIVGLKDVCGNKRLWRMLIAEFIGTFFLVLIGCGSCLSGWSPTYAPSTVQIALAFGITVATMVQALGHVSGCHINPAVSVGLVAAGQCSLLKALMYVVAQCVGGIVGGAVLQTLTPDEIQGNLGITLVNEKLSPVQGMFIEALITFVLVLTICGVCDDLRKDVKGSAPLAIGLAVTVCHLMAIPYTGSSMNPARTLGVAVLSKIWTHHWVYWAGPLMGGIIGGFFYNISFKERPAIEKQ